MDKKSKWELKKIRNVKLLSPQYSRTIMVLSGTASRKQIFLCVIKGWYEGIFPSLKLKQKKINLKRMGVWKYSMILKTTLLFLWGMMWDKNFVSWFWHYKSENMEMEKVVSSPWQISDQDWINS